MAGTPPVIAEERGCVGCGENNTVVDAAGRSFTGTQVIPNGAGGPVRRASIGAASGGSSCLGCSYRLVALCELGNGCRELGLQQCPDEDATRYAVFVTRPPAPEQAADSVCLGDGEQPVPVDAITAQVRTLLDSLIPTDAEVAVQPAGGALINVPTIVRADGARQPVSQQFFPSGFAVDVTARPVLWTWTFGPGERDAFRYPGEAYAARVDPTTTGRHATWTYARPGSRSLQVVVTWEAAYVLPGVGTVPVGQVDRTSPAVPLQVYGSQTELVAG